MDVAEVVMAAAAAAAEDMVVIRRSHSRESKGNMGTYRWMASEMIKVKPYTRKVDVYSFGIVLWELTTALLPFQGMTHVQAAFAVSEKIFRTPDKGWAVRTLELIPSGALVCEYTGVIRKSDELDAVSLNDYIMEIDCVQTMKGMGQKRVGDVSASFTNLLEKADDTNDENPEFSIDGGSTGSVSRFINHSCDPFFSVC